jgi:hypothetical protein
MNKIPKECYFELYVFCMDYHSGQWSRGYRLLSKLGPARLTDNVINECRDSEMYLYLEQHYADKV